MLRAILTSFFSFQFPHYPLLLYIIGVFLRVQEYLLVEQSILFEKRIIFIISKEMGNGKEGMVFGV
jgi:hypothetical protein